MSVVQFVIPIAITALIRLMNALTARYRWTCSAPRRRSDRSAVVPSARLIFSGAPASSMSMKAMRSSTIATAENASTTLAAVAAASSKTEPVLILADSSSACRSTPTEDSHASPPCTVASMRAR